MAEKYLPKLPVPPLSTTAYTDKKCKKRKTDEEKMSTKKKLNRARDKTRVNIGLAFQRWRELRNLKGFKSDGELAVFLLDRYCAMKTQENLRQKRTRTRKNGHGRGAKRPGPCLRRSQLLSSAAQSIQPFNCRDQLAPTSSCAGQPAVPTDCAEQPASDN
ncbi:hypothetical protein ANANG_G00266990 [Anguilla anguilla]|uniref:Uncharacterized protein n=1 Tax=Anguilla anguilla TaxID=7936 RepID=A0A9D3LRE1_ANGAN|nr:hypothetical protein ANANG_G00266990 [Anguilla anguilla]